MLTEGILISLCFEVIKRFIALNNLNFILLILILNSCNKRNEKMQLLNMIINQNTTYKLTAYLEHW